MLRRSLAVLALLPLAACQDYNFNPVGRCVIQPGAARIQLASVAAADVLFVVDDSGSMAPEQASLARNFQAFIDALTAEQNDRKANGLDPFDFHLAITTSSIFEAWKAQGAPVCGAPSASTCTINQPTFSWSPAYTYACTGTGDCPDVIPQYHNFTGCAAGVGADRAPYPSGDFVALGQNPRVLHFTKDLFDGTPASATKLQALVAQFQQNIAVGTCGSGMEQHLEAGRLAVQKAIAGTQPITAGEWPHPGAKLVVVWVGDEDDCSNPKTTDPTKTLFFTTARQAPGADVCTDEEAKPLAEQKLFKVADYADYFTTLNRSFSAAFIYSAVNCRQDAQGNRVCDPGVCTCQCPVGCSTCGPSAAGNCNIPADCGGRSAGSRLHDLSAALRGKGANTLDASVCDADFGQTLKDIAQLVKPPAGLTLPTTPAAAEVATLRILSADGQRSRACAGPAVVDSAAARAAADWWFVDCATGAFSAAPTADAHCIAINHASGRCEPNPGETYVAQYLGVVPPPSTDNPRGGCLASTECQTLFGSAQARCDIAAGQARGTCVCGQ
jgi:hypothetical protein